MRNLRTAINTVTSRNAFFFINVDLNELKKKITNGLKSIVEI